jgi:hypothetical protein
VGCLEHAWLKWAGIDEYTCDKYLDVREHGEVLWNIPYSVCRVLRLTLSRLCAGSSTMSQDVPSRVVTVRELLER